MFLARRRPFTFRYVFGKAECSCHGDLDTVKQDGEPHVNTSMQSTVGNYVEIVVEE